MGRQAGGLRAIALGVATLGAAAVLFGVTGTNLTAALSSQGATVAHHLRLDTLAHAAPLGRALAESGSAAEMSAGGTAQRRPAGEGSGDKADGLWSGSAGSSGSMLDSYHVVVTADGSISHMWQAQLCYYWYNQAKRRHPDSPMGGFTRILHSGREDDLAALIPTVIVDLLPRRFATVVKAAPSLERPHAVRQWLQLHGAALPERYLLLLEPDMLLRSPPPLWATPDSPAAYESPYPPPAALAALAKRNFSGAGAAPLALQPIGPTPLQIHKDQLAGLMDAWLDISLGPPSLAVWEDEAARSGPLGVAWDRHDAYAIAAAQAGIVHQLHPEFAATPPADRELKKGGRRAHLLHYPYSLDFDAAGQPACPGREAEQLACWGSWHFDRRSHSLSYPPLPMAAPPAPATEAALELVRMLNRGAKRVRPWPVPCPFQPYSTVRCAATGDIYLITGKGPGMRAARQHTPQSYLRAHKPGATDVRCDWIQTCPRGAGMPEPGVELLWRHEDHPEEAEAAEGEAGRPDARQR